MTAADVNRWVDPAPHEFAGNFNYNEYGLSPWFALDRVVKNGDGSVETTMQARGETWEVKVYYQDGNLVSPDGGETPAGATIQHDTIREFRIRVEADDGGNATRSANFHVRPRWLGLEAETDTGTTREIPVPKSLANTDTDAVNVRVQGSNIPFNQYDDLLRAAADTLDVNPCYFPPERHPTSNVQDAARYVRLDRDASSPIHARDGPLTGLAHVLENDRDGYRKLVQNDTDERGNQLPGYYHTATLGPERVREVFPDHGLPVEVKHYYSKEALNRDPDDPLAHPKLESSYQVKRWDGTADAATDAALDQLQTELDDWLFSVLDDAGLDLRAGVPGGGRTYVEDEYFDATNASTDARAVALDLTQIRHEQESVVYHYFGDGGLSPVEQDTLTTLVTDGGEVSPDQIAAENDRHTDSVYRALDRMNDLVNHEYGSVSLQSTYVSELVADALREAKDAVGRAVTATAEAKRADDRGLDERTSAFLAWCETHGVEFDDDSVAADGVSISFGEVEDSRDVRKLLREGLDLWRDMNRDEAEYRMGTYRYDRPDGRRVAGKVWRMIQSTATR